jgi:hypothetical protein
MLDGKHLYDPHPELKNMRTDGDGTFALQTTATNSTMDYVLYTRPQQEN